MLYILIGSLEI